MSGRKRLGEELLALACAEGDRASEAHARFVLSRAAHQRGADEEAMALAVEAVALYRELGDEQWLPWAVQRLGIETDYRWRPCQGGRALQRSAGAVPGTWQRI